jgi:hypothetical protein
LIAVAARLAEPAYVTHQEVSVSPIASMIVILLGFTTDKQASVIKSRIAYFQLPVFRYLLLLIGMCAFHTLPTASSVATYAGLCQSPQIDAGLKERFVASSRELLHRQGVLILYIFQRALVIRWSA